MNRNQGRERAGTHSKLNPYRAIRLDCLARPALALLPLLGGRLNPPVHPLSLSFLLITHITSSPAPQLPGSYNFRPSYFFLFPTSFLSCHGAMAGLHCRMGSLRPPRVVLSGHVGALPEEDDGLRPQVLPPVGPPPAPIDNACTTLSLRSCHHTHSPLWCNGLIRAPSTRISLVGAVV